MRKEKLEKYFLIRLDRKTDQNLAALAEQQKQSRAAVVRDLVNLAASDNPDLRKQTN